MPNPTLPRRLTRLLLLAATAGLVAFAAAPDARAQLCGEPICLTLNLTEVEQALNPPQVPWWGAPAAQVNASAGYAIAGGTYSNVSFEFVGSPYFLGSIANAPPGYTRTCQAMNGNVVEDPLAAPIEVWRATCTFTYTDNEGVLTVPELISGQIGMMFIAQLYAMPVDYNAIFRVTLRYTKDGVDYSTSAESTNIRPGTAFVRGWAQWRDTTGVQLLPTPTEGNVLSRGYRELFWAENREPTSGEFGSRSIEQVQLRMTLPDWVRYQGWTNYWGYNESWTNGPDHTAQIGAHGGVVHLVFNGTTAEGAPRWWPLGVSRLMSAWNLANTHNPAWIQNTHHSSQIWLNWSVDCDDIPVQFGTTEAEEPTTPIVTSAQTSSGGTVISPSHTRNLSVRHWVAPNVAGANSCDLSYSAAATNKTGQGIPWIDRPPVVYPREGDPIRWWVNLAPPAGVLEVGPTTIIDKIPPFSHLRAAPPAGGAEWTAYVCRFDDINWWSLASTNVTATTTWPYYGLDRFEYYVTDNIVLDPDDFDPDADPWAWDAMSQTGCAVAADICPYTLVNNRWVAPDPTSTACLGRMPSNLATHVVWSTIARGSDVDTHTWVHPTSPLSLPPSGFTLEYWTVVGNLDALPGSDPNRVAVRNEIVIGGGNVPNPTCAIEPNPGFAWFNRICRNSDSVVIACPDSCYWEFAQAGDLPAHATRGHFAHFDKTLVVNTEVRRNYTTIPVTLSEEETAVLSFGWRPGTAQASIPNPRFTITLPVAFRPRTHDYDTNQPVSLQPLSWPTTPTSDAVPELRYVPIATQSTSLPGFGTTFLSRPLISELLAASIQLEVDKYMVDLDDDGTPESWRYDIEFKPDNEEANFDIGHGWFVNDGLLNHRGVFQIAVEPSSEYPYVQGQNYPAAFEVSDASFPRGTPAGTDGLAFTPSVSTNNVNVIMAAELVLTAGPTCRPNSARPSYRMELSAKGVPLFEAEGIFIVPLSEGLVFAGAAQLPNPAITATRVLEVTNQPGLENALQNSPDTIIWSAFNTFPVGDYATVTGVRLRYLAGQQLPAWATDEFRVDLDKTNLTLADIGTQFTSRGWTRAGGTTALPYAQSEPLDTNTIGMCPVRVLVTKRFDENGNNIPDNNEALLSGWTFNMNVAQGQSLNDPDAPLLNPDGTVAVDPTAPQTGTTDGTGTVSLFAWPGQTYTLTETIPDAVAPFGPTWTFVGQVPAPSGSGTPWQVNFDQLDHAFANTCSCGDEYTCGEDDRCVAPGVCEFGQAIEAGDGFSTSPTLCEPHRFYSVVVDGDGAFVGSVVCFLDTSNGSANATIVCDADSNGVLNVNTTRNACD